MCCSCPVFCRKFRKTLNKECFSHICPHNTFFYWLIVLWILLIVLSILFYGIILIGLLKIEDEEYTRMIQNISIQIVNGLFTFAAVLNLPVRLRRLCDLYSTKITSSTGPTETDDNPGVMRKVSLMLFPSGRDDFLTQSTEAWEQESRFIFERLAWSTKHIIIQALLWNSLFQIINQVFRCIYYSYELADTYPGSMWVNVFFPLAILASVVAAMTQALAENRFREKHDLEKKPNDLKKTLKEFWYNLWKDQTEGQVDLAIKLNNKPPALARSPLLDLRKRTVMGRELQASWKDDPSEEPSITEDENDQYVGPAIMEEKEEPETGRRIDAAGDNNIKLNHDEDRLVAVKDELDTNDVSIKKHQASSPPSEKPMKKDSISSVEITDMNPSK